MNNRRAFESIIKIMQPKYEFVEYTLAIRRRVAELFHLVTESLVVKHALMRLVKLLQSPAKKNGKFKP